MLGAIRVEHREEHIWCRASVEGLVRYVISISLIGAGFTLLLDKLAVIAEAPATVHTFVVHGSAGVFACAGVALYRAINPD